MAKTVVTVHGNDVKQKIPEKLGIPEKPGFQDDVKKDSQEGQLLITYSYDNEYKLSNAKKIYKCIYNCFYKGLGQGYINLLNCKSTGF